MRINKVAFHVFLSAFFVKISCQGSPNISVLASSRVNRLSFPVSCFAVAPQVKQSSPSRVVEPVGLDEVKLLCNVKDAQNYTWYKNGKRILQSCLRYCVKPTRFLRILNVVKSDSGMFVCVASNSYGRVNCTIRLIVEGN